MVRRISHAKGKGSINHNNRNHIYKNVDLTKTKNNITYAKETLEQAYQHCFGQALTNYNIKQKRADRKINDYYNHLFGNTRKDTVATSSNKEKSFYEIAVGIGDRNTCPVGSADGELAAKILDEYAKGFSERNPNFYVFNSVMHLDEQTPHLHIDYVPIANGYKNGMETRNSISVALQQMGFGKDKDSINKWRKAERRILREICEKHGMEIAEETQGRGKTFTPDEYKKIRDEVKEELRADPEVLEEIKDDIKVDIEEEVRHGIRHLFTEVDKYEQELENLQHAVSLEQDNLKTEKDKVKAEKQQFKDMQTKFKPRKDDLDKIQKLKREANPGLLKKITITKEDWDFIISIAEQHARISDTTLTALEKHEELTATLKRCQSLYLAVATVIADKSYADRDKIKHKVQDMLKDIEDWRAIAWLFDGMVNSKPSDIDDILKIRQATIDKKHGFAKKVQDYNQTDILQKVKDNQQATTSPQKTKKKSYNHDR